MSDYIKQKSTINIKYIPKLLKKCIYFQDCTNEQLKYICEASHLAHYPAQTPIFIEGDPAESFFMVISGQVKVFKLSKDGRELILHLISPGETFAEFPFFMGLKTYPAYATCMEESNILFVDGKAFHTLASQSHEVLWRIVGRLSNRLRQYNGLAGDLSLRSVESRLAKYILEVSEQTVDHAYIKIHKKALASILGTIPETLSRSFARLSQKNLIKLEGNKVHILDRLALSELGKAL